MKFLRVLCIVCSLVISAFAIDREAFTFTKYDLDVRVEPEQQRLAVRGRITLRNDSLSPQKNLALQISSTLDWKSIQFGGKTVQFVTHEYSSDIDHTGALSEAIVTLPREIPPRGTLELDVGYEGLIALDVTRLTQIGVPEDKAKQTDWDQIDKSFTAVRGIGYVVWYPVGTEAASLSEANSVEETVGRWKAKHADSTMSLRFESTLDPETLFSGTPAAFAVKPEPEIAQVGAFSIVGPGVSVPTFVIANYHKLAATDLLTIQYLPGQEEAAKAYADVVAKIDPVVPGGRGTGSLQILGLPDPDAASFVTGGMLMLPLKAPVTNEGLLNIVYAQARQQMSSPRAWIQEGLAHYAQADFIDEQSSRSSALNYLREHQTVLVEAERTKPSGAEKPGSGWPAAHSLINAPDGLYLQTKAMYVWWMLRDMLGGKLNAALLDYRALDDKDAAYAQRLIEKLTHRDLQWFFDDWVYRDRGLPDFRIDSVYSRAMVRGGFLVTVSVENLGDAGAEVPITVRFDGGELSQRLEVRAKSKNAIRIEVSSPPQEVIVNDGSVPESNMSNNTFKVEAQEK